MVAYFFVLIPPRFLTSKAPALWRSRTECDWDIWRSIFSQSTHLSRGHSIWLFPFSSSSFSWFHNEPLDLCPGGRVGIRTESALELHHRSFLLIGPSRLFPEIPSPLFQSWWCGEAHWKHSTSLCYKACKGWLNNVTHVSFSRIRLPEEVWLVEV